MSRSVFHKVSIGAVVTLAILAAVVGFPLISAASPSHTSVAKHQHPIVNQSVKNDVSQPLRSVAGKPSNGHGGEADDFPSLKPVRNGRPNNLNPHVQSQVGSAAAPATSNNFDGVGNGFTGPNGTFSVASAPPDTNGAVGPQDYVQMVNTDFAVFNKDASRGTVGSVRYGPVAINTLWSGFGGLCQTDNDGDPTVVYDGSPIAGSSRSSPSPARLPHSISASPSRRRVTPLAHIIATRSPIELPRLPKDGCLAGCLLRNLQPVQRGWHLLPRRERLRLQPRADADRRYRDPAMFHHQQ